MGTSDDQARDAFAEFKRKVTQTVFVHDLSPQVTASAIKTAFSQFGEVIRVSFIPNYLEYQDIPQCALVEMGDPRQADKVVNVVKDYLFMISGMPRPVRARAASMEMFSERPRHPDRRIVARWLDPSHPKFEVCQILKRLVRKHAVESAALLKVIHVLYEVTHSLSWCDDNSTCILQYQLGEEEKLEKRQKGTLEETYEKYQMIERVVKDGSVRRLARQYNMRLAGDE